VQYKKSYTINSKTLTTTTTVTVTPVWAYSCVSEKWESIAYYNTHKTTLYIRLQFWQTQADFRNDFTVGLRLKLTNLSLL